ncbi:hypothetical protein BW737_003070 [Actinomyces ruminis]|uniref:DUF11 domain-containing protein n=1 Tax=Actinomyces ruminis TaxID=1937003 RepID=A0ABX4MD26_9ACTO|nr:hypothetical protein BW737_003070 [Actinomyces ruminis]
MSSATLYRSRAARAGRRALTVLTAVLVLVGALALSPVRADAADLAAHDVLWGTVATTALAADAEDVQSAGQVTLAVTSMAPQVLGTGEDITLTGTIANGTDQALSGTTLVAQMQSRTELTTDGLASWLADEQDTPLATIALETLEDDVAPGAAVNFRLTISADNLPLHNTEQWGPRGIQVALTQGYTTLTQDRTILLWNPEVQVSPTRVTAFVPITASPAELLALTARHPRPGFGPRRRRFPGPHRERNSVRNHHGCRRGLRGDTHRAARAGAGPAGVVRRRRGAGRGSGPGGRPRLGIDRAHQRGRHRLTDPTGRRQRYPGDRGDRCRRPQAGARRRGCGRRRGCPALGRRRSDRPGTPGRDRPAQLRPTTRRRQCRGAGRCRHLRRLVGQRTGYDHARSPARLGDHRRRRPRRCARGRGLDLYAVGHHDPGRAHGAHPGCWCVGGNRRQPAHR